MSKIPTGNVLMELFSKASLEVKTSWTHNQARIPVQTQVCYSVQRHQEMPKDCRKTVCFLQSQYLWQGLHSNRLNREVQKQHREHERVPVEAVNKAWGWLWGKETWKQEAVMQYRALHHALSPQGSLQDLALSWTWWMEHRWQGAAWGLGCVMQERKTLVCALTDELVQTWASATAHKGMGLTLSDKWHY